VKDPNNLRKVLKDAFPQWNYSFHAIRHWFASLGLSSGAGDTQMARLLGHKTTRTTKDIYGHLLDEGSATIIDMVQKAIGNQ
jgi:integrase